MIEALHAAAPGSPSPAEPLTPDPVFCEACERGYRLEPGGLHYNDEAGAQTWGVCRKVTAALRTSVGEESK